MGTYSEIAKLKQEIEELTEKLNRLKTKHRDIVLRAANRSSVMGLDSGLTWVIGDGEVVVEPGQDYLIVRFMTNFSGTPGPGEIKLQYDEVTRHLPPNLHDLSNTDLYIAVDSCLSKAITNAAENAIYVETEKEHGNWIRSEIINAAFMQNKLNNMLAKFGTCVIERGDGGRITKVSTTEDRRVIVSVKSFEHDVEKETVFWLEADLSMRVVKRKQGSLLEEAVVLPYSKLGTMLFMDKTYMTMRNGSDDEPPKDEILSRIVDTMLALIFTLTEETK